MTPQPQSEEIFLRILLQEIKKKEFKPYMNHPKKAVWFEDIDNIVREQFRSRSAISSNKTINVIIPADRKWTFHVTDDIGFADIWEKGYTDEETELTITTKPHTHTGGEP